MLIEVISLAVHDLMGLSNMGCFILFWSHYLVCFMQATGNLPEALVEHICR